jgi:NADPH:quinone reductase-like Zn-dependent oxidoreductase
MATMKAVQIHAYGGPEVLKYEDAPRPEPKPDEVLIRVHAAAINPVDWKTREGLLQKFMPYSFPLILGWDVAGIVEAIGSNVEGFTINDAVYAMSGLQAGGYGEYIVVPTSAVAAKPRSLSYIEAASVPLVALTAWQALFDKANLTVGQRVLIHAAAGGVGSFAVQFAKVKGAVVIGTASTNKQAFVKALGADEVIDYRTTRFEEAVQNVDVVLDLVGGETQERSWQVLKPGGILVSTVSPPNAETAASYKVRSDYFSAQAIASQLQEIANLIDAGRVKTVVETVLPLQDVRHGHEMLQSGYVQGKIVLQVSA